MAPTKGPTISVKVPINWDALGSQGRTRLEQIVGRDSRVIRAYIGVIEHHEEELLRGKDNLRIDGGRLDQLTLTALQVPEGVEKRTTVPHDFKERFPRISTNELVECRRVATSNYESYLALRAKRNRKVSRPTEANNSGRLPRWVYMPYRAKLVEHETHVSRWWLDIRDSFDSVPEKRRIHDRLRLPLKMSPFHLNQINRGKLKAAQVFTDYKGKWWVTLAVRLKVERYDPDGLVQAVLGIDLGINKAICTTLVTERKASETRYFTNEKKREKMQDYDSLISELQHAKDNRESNGKNTTGIVYRLKEFRRKRRHLSREYDRSLVSQLLVYIDELSNRYSLFVALGRPKGIRAIARKGNYQGPRFRRIIHRWTFSSISKILRHGLAQLGWPVEGKNKRFHLVPEAWTSIICWKCGRKGHRPRQSLFVCSCGFRTNADRNGSLNIARRLIKIIPSLRNDKHGLGRWVTPERAPAPKAGRKTSSERKPELSSTDDASHPGESAAVHYVQLDLLGFGNESKMSDDDHAVVKTVENLAVAANDASRPQQETEAATGGGIQSQ
ncbi:MAG: zinc ribbon domain-containing protein [Promethearchaeia archaeon]